MKEETEQVNKRTDGSKKPVFSVTLWITVIFGITALNLIYSRLFYDGPYIEIILDRMPVILLSVVIAISIDKYPEKFSYFIVRTFAVMLFSLTFAGVCFAILSPESLNIVDKIRLREAQVFLAVSSAGMMGGLMRYFSHDQIIKNEVMNLWHMVHAAIIGLFVSLVLFLVLRAGIINQTQIDTFNVWGVTGVSAITGFFAERVIDRFSSLYNEVLGNNSKQNENS